MKIDVLELFSGIGGFSKGLSSAGFEIENHYFSEVDNHAIANYKYNFPNAIYVGSVKNVRHIIRAIKPGRKLFITFGSPCQDFSLAGKGLGLDGSKSSLIKYAIFLIRWLRPDVFIWENVKGAYSTNDGADYWAIIKAFADLSGYRHEQQLLNSTWVIPQNRERIYHVGFSSASGFSGVFPITKADTVYFRPGKTKKEIHSNNRDVLTQQARQYASWNGDFVKVFSATTAGYEIAEVGDSINMAMPGSSTRRGRVGKKTIQTIDTQFNQVAFTEVGIRAFTEVEAERFQSFPDDWTKYGNYDGNVKEISKAQRYKMCGNAVTVAIVEIIGIKLSKMFNRGAGV